MMEIAWFYLLLLAVSGTAVLGGFAVSYAAFRFGGYAKKGMFPTMPKQTLLARLSLIAFFVLWAVLLAAIADNANRGPTDPQGLYSAIRFVTIHLPIFGSAFALVVAIKREMFHPDGAFHPRA